jgi:hypothetical protein
MMMPFALVMVAVGPHLLLTCFYSQSFSMIDVSFLDINSSNCTILQKHTGRIRSIRLNFLGHVKKQQNMQHTVGFLPSHGRRAFDWLVRIRSCRFSSAGSCWIKYAVKISVNFSRCTMVYVWPGKAVKPTARTRCIHRHLECDNQL